MEHEIYLFGYLRVLIRRRYLILLIVLVATLGASIVSLVLPKKYQARATLIPIGGKDTSKLDAVASSTIMPGFPVLSGVGGGSISTQLLVFLESRSLAERTIKEHSLESIFVGKGQSYNLEDPVQLETLVSELKGMVSFDEVKKGGRISITATANSPEQAVTIANSYLDSFANYMLDNAFTVAKRNRIFVENQLLKNKVDLLNAGKALAAFYTTNKISNVFPYVDVDVSLRGSPSLGFGKNDSLVSDAGGDRTTKLQNNLQEVEKNIKKSEIVKDIPQQVYFQYLTVRKRLLGDINDMLTQQYEISKIQESKEDLTFQVVDWARIPLIRSSPKRKQIVIKTFAISLLAAAVSALLLEYLPTLIDAVKGVTPTRPANR